MLRAIASLLSALAFAMLVAAPANAQNEVKNWPATEGDYIATNFHFHDGETMAQLRLHYTTLGKPVRDARGRVSNAVLIIHGTGGDGHQFFRPQFANVLFSPGGLLDISKYYIILPDDIGHGRSSKPSDGLRAKFPHYDYDDMVAAQYELVTRGLNVNHLRLVMGTSMGCMQSFMWGEAYPDFMDALMPLACMPMEIAGRNRMWRDMVIQGIKNDPAWMGGNYKTEPQMALRIGVDMLIIAGSAPLPMQIAYPTRQAADKFVADYTARELKTLDANDLLYQAASSRDYNPLAKLTTIKAYVMWVNSGDDFINPPGLNMAQQQVKQIPHGKYVLIPASANTHGHGTHTWAAIWHDQMAELLKESAH